MSEYLLEDGSGSYLLEDGSGSYLLEDVPQVMWAAKGGASASNLYTVNLGTAACTSVGAIGFALTGLAWDDTTSTLFGATSNQDPTEPLALVTVNPSTGAGTLIAVFTGNGGLPITDITVSNAGDLYGVDREGRLHSIDKATAVCTPIGSGPDGTYSASLEYASDGLFLVAYDAEGIRLYQVDPGTGDHSTPSGILDYSGTPAAMAITTGGVMYVVQSAATVTLGTLATDETVTDIGAMVAKSDALAADGTRGAFGWIPPPPPAANDDFENAILLTGLSGAETAAITSATRQNAAGEPTAASRKTVWWKYVAPADGTFTANAWGTVDGDLNPVATYLTIYTGLTISGLTEVAQAIDVGDHSSEISYVMTGGQTYYIQQGLSILVPGVDSLTGTHAIDWGFVIATAPVNDDFANAIALSGNSGTVAGTNIAATLEAGEPDTETDSSVWYEFTPPYDGTLALTVVPDAGDSPIGSADLRVYTGTAVSGLTPIATDPPTPTHSGDLAVTAGTTYRIRVASGLRVLKVARPDFSSSYMEMPVAGSPVTTYAEMELWFDAASKAAWRTFDSSAPGFGAINLTTDVQGVWMYASTAGSFDQWTDNSAWYGITVDPVVGAGLFDPETWHTVTWSHVADGATRHLTVDGVDESSVSADGWGPTNLLTVGIFGGPSGVALYVKTIKLGTTLGGSDLLDYDAARDGDPTAFGFTIYGAISLEGAP